MVSRERKGEKREKEKSSCFFPCYWCRWISPFGQKHFYVVMGVIKSEMDVSDLCKCLVYNKLPQHHYSCCCKDITQKQVAQMSSFHSFLCRRVRRNSSRLSNEYEKKKEKTWSSQSRLLTSCSFFNRKSRTVCTIFLSIII